MTKICSSLLGHQKSFSKAVLASIQIQGNCTIFVWQLDHKPLEWSKQDNPAKRQEMIEKIQGHQVISSMGHARDKLVLTIDDIAVDVFCKAFLSDLVNSKVKLIEKK